MVVARLGSWSSFVLVVFVARGTVGGLVWRGDKGWGEGFSAFSAFGCGGGLGMFVVDDEGGYTSLSHSHYSF